MPVAKLLPAKLDDTVSGSWSTGMVLLRGNTERRMSLRRCPPILSAGRTLGRRLGDLPGDLWLAMVYRETRPGEDRADEQIKEVG